MKKLTSFLLTIAFTASLFIVTQTVQAATYDWTDGFYDFLIESMQSFKQGNDSLTMFALYDIDNDNIPELILQNTKREGSYQIYNYDNTEVELERSLASSSFHITDEGDFIVGYGSDTGMTYVYYNQDKTLAASDILFRTRKVSQNDNGEWEWVYFHGRREISEIEFNRLINEYLLDPGLMFLEINEANLREQLLLGLGFPKHNERIHLSGIRNNAGTNVTLNFIDGKSVEAARNGQEFIYGLLLVNGVFVYDFFPVNIEGYTLVPVRAVSTNLGASVDWIGDLQKINIRSDYDLIEMYIDENYALVNGSRVSLEVAPTLIDGITYVPLRFVSENLNSDVYFTDRDGNFPPIISIESRRDESYIDFDDYDAVHKASYIMKNIDWSAGGNIFSRAFVQNNINIKLEDLVYGRYWSVTIDTRETQRLLFDKFTGHVFSKYLYGNEFGIQAGVEHAIDAMIANYR